MNRPTASLTCGTTAFPGMGLQLWDHGGGHALGSGGAGVGCVGSDFTPKICYRVSMPNQTMYKFVEPDFVVGNLTDEHLLIKVSKLDDLNDPNEGILSTTGNAQVVRFAMDHVFTEQSQSEIDVVEMLRPLIEKNTRPKFPGGPVYSEGLQMKDLLSWAGNKHRTTSFTSNPTSHLMWAHYAKKCQGVAFGLCQRSVEQTRAATGQVNTDFFKIKYSTAPPSLRPSLSYSTAFMDAMTTKSVEWMYEQEWRLFFKAGDANLGAGGGFAAVDYTCLTSIVFNRMKVCPDFVERVRHRVRDELDLQDVAFLQVVGDEAGYGYELRDLDF